MIASARSEFASAGSFVLRAARHGFPSLAPAWMALLGCVLLAGPASALPRFSARYEQNCGLCHVNPTGGGQRALYASQMIAPTELSGHRMSPDQAAEDIDPQIGKNLTFGFDGRSIFHKAPDTTLVGIENFIQMEGQVYLTVQVDQRFLGYINRGLTATPEVFALAYVLPWSGYVKAGRFYPPFGWRFDDHTAFTRIQALHGPSNGSDLDGAPAFDYDTGMEAGIFPGRFALIGSLENGSFAGTPDNNKRLAWSGQALYRLHLGPVGIGAGGSYWHNDEPDARRIAGGPYGYLKFGPVTWVGEADWTRTEPAGTAGGTSGIARSTHWTTSNELAWNAARGVDLRFTYDFYDPDTDHKTGSRARFGFGADWMPYPYLVLSPAANVHRFTRGGGIRGSNYTMLQLQAHVLY